MRGTGCCHLLHCLPLLPLLHRLLRCCAAGILPHSHPPCLQQTCSQQTAWRRDISRNFTHHCLPPHAGSAPSALPGLACHTEWPPAEAAPTGTYSSGPLLRTRSSKSSAAGSELGDVADELARQQVQDAVMAEGQQECEEEEEEEAGGLLAGGYMGACVVLCVHRVW